MAKIVTTLQGVAEFELVLKKLGPRIAGKAGAAALSAGAEVVRREVEARAPVRTEGGPKLLRKKGKLAGLGRLPGFLRAHIRKRKVPADTPFTARYVVQPSRLAFYAMFVEFGTSTQPARPFLRPAFEAVQGQVLKTIGDKLGQRIEKEAAKLAGPVKPPRR